MDTILLALQNTVEGKAIAGIAALALLDFVTGSLRAIQGGQFSLDKFSTWVRTSLIQVVIITLTIVAGKALGSITIGDFSIDVIGLAGLAAAASFAATTGKSILDNLNPKVADTPPPDAT
jgi:Bacteriophage holin family